MQTTQPLGPGPDPVGAPGVPGPPGIPGYRFSKSIRENRQNMKKIVFAILEVAANIVCALAFVYMLYFFWINTPPFDYPYTGIRWYYNPPSTFNP